MELDYQQQNEWYVKEAIKQFRQIGWTGKVYGTRLVHPDGRNNFPSCGAVFIYGHPNQEHYLSYMIALFPNQYLPLHHHEDRKSVLRVVGGVVSMSGISGAINVKQGEYMIPMIGEKYGYGAGWGGALLIGICHKNHINDYHWERLFIGDDGDGSYTTHPYKEELKPFEVMVGEIHTTYKKVNSKALNNDALLKVRREMDLLIPSYQNRKKVVDCKVVAMAAMAGRLDFLKWVLSSFGGTVFNYELTFEYAGRGGSTEVQQWLKDTFSSYT